MRFKARKGQKAEQAKAFWLRERRAMAEVEAATTPSHQIQGEKAAFKMQQTTKACKLLYRQAGRRGMASTYEDLLLPLPSPCDEGGGTSKQTSSLQVTEGQATLRISGSRLTLAYVPAFVGCSLVNHSTVDDDFFSAQRSRDRIQ